MSRPQYQRIADELRQRITKGEYAPGERLPSRQAIATEYGVGPRVAADALQRLVAEGHVVSRAGSGSYVRAKPPLRRLTRGWYRERDGSPFAADMAIQGRRAAWHAVSEEVIVPDEIAARLALDPGVEVMRTRYTFSGDDEPVMLSTSYEPMEITRQTSVVFPERGPYAGRGVVERMREIRQRITHASEIVTARPATTDEAERLQATRDTIVLVIQRTYHTAERPVETADIVVPVDRYELAYLIPVDRD